MKAARNGVHDGAPPVSKADTSRSGHLLGAWLLLGREADKLKSVVVEDGAAALACCARRWSCGLAPMGRRRVLTSPSQIAFMRGAWTAVRRILVPTAWKMESKDAVKFDPRSRSRN